MTSAEKAELTLIPLASLACFLAAPILPGRIALGSLLLVVFVLLLSQGLLRDLWLLAHNRRGAPSGAARTLSCMCVESVVGATGVLAGIVVLGAGIGRPIDIGAAGWALAVFAVTATGFAIKDLVFEWNPWSIRRDKDHLNIIVRWKK